MKKLILVLTLLMVGCGIGVVGYKYFMTNDARDESSEMEYSFDTSYGTLKIEADKALSARGTAGASNNIFYIKNSNLYCYVHEGEDELYAENVDKIYYETAQTEQITVVVDEDTNILKESLYLNYVSTENEIFTFETAYGTVEIEATLALNCRGAAGASNNIFYIKNDNLYYYVHEGEDELYAENVDKIYYETAQAEQITVATNQHTNIIKENMCLDYN